MNLSIIEISHDMKFFLDGKRNIMMDQITKIKSNQIQPVYFAFGTESFFQEQLKKID